MAIDYAQVGQAVLEELASSRLMHTCFATKDGVDLDHPECVYCWHANAAEQLGQAVKHSLSRQVWQLKAEGKLG
jgi:hypothetical protein